MDATKEKFRHAILTSLNQTFFPKAGCSYLRHSMMDTIPLVEKWFHQQARHPGKRTEAMSRGRTLLLPC